MITITLKITEMRKGECAIDYSMRDETHTETERDIMRFFAALFHKGQNHLTKIAGGGHLLESENPLTDEFVKQVGDAYLAHKYKDDHKK